MKFSIIIPVHNAEQTLNACVESFVAQKYEDKEIILIENNSTDSSWMICCELQNKYQNVLAYKVEGEGVSLARNTGLDYASGDVIAFCDADDTAYHESLEVVNKAFRDRECSMVIGGFMIVREHSENSKTFSYPKMIKLKQLPLLLLTDDRIMGSVWNKFYKRELLENLRFFTDLRMCEDLCFLMQITNIFPNQKVSIITTPVYNYVQHNQSVTYSADKMFDEQGEFEYGKSILRVLDVCVLPVRTKILLKRKIFVLAAATFCRFTLTKAQKDVLIGAMKKNFVLFSLSYLVNIRESLAITKRLILKIIHKK